MLADVGVNDVMAGPKYINPALVAAPPCVVTDTMPVAPPANIALTLVSDVAVNDDAATPPKLTAFAVSRLVPYIITVSNIPPDVGVKDVITGVPI